MSDEGGCLELVTVGTIVAAVVWWFGWAMEWDEGNRQNALNQIAAQTCRTNNSDFGRLTTQFCVNAYEVAIQKAEDDDVFRANIGPRTLFGLLSPNYDGDLNYTLLRQKITYDRKIVLDTVRNTSRLEKVTDALIDPISHLTMGGAQPFLKSGVSYDIKSLVQVDGRWTGKFSITIKDEGDKASRTFSYDHVTGNIKQSEDKNDESVNVSTDNNSVTIIVGSGESKEYRSFSTTAHFPDRCGAPENKTACAVVSRFLDSLNRLTPAGRDTLQWSIAQSFGDVKFDEFKLTDTSLTLDENQWAIYRMGQVITNFDLKGTPMTPRP